MTPEEVREAVALARKEGLPGLLVEVSGGVNLRTVRSYAEAGPDLISVGALTHSAPAADVSLEVEPC
ncbi:MAG: Quinolinate phosphoribosyltransferase [decarboxylating] [uncultured Rubrobacteraceae bacterium]|uniref:Quinolinate phosphoribosyltransferase [decarboxylating] n=1 Tax=uncultured Rubrobacteraceae bacterium TaxID=349277 RepID=A0A6J4R856_9ACTN|nr:MAG: Quinolinate phosphoribosyltransferase [decarboxylating] [uncultured Rubrobacteraceae bacterium]